MTIPTIPPALLLVLPFVVAILSGLIGQKSLPNWLNGIILLVTLIATAFACLVLTGKLGSNWYTDVALLTAFAAALISGPLSFIQDWLRAATPSIIGLHLLFQQDVVKVEQAVPILKPRKSAVSVSAPKIEDNLG